MLWFDSIFISVGFLLNLNPGLLLCVIIKKIQMQNQVDIQQILNRPLCPDDWPNLERISQKLHSHLVDCSSNRKVDQAMKTKEKIDELNTHFKERFQRANMQQFQSSIKALADKQEEQVKNFEKQWTTKIQEVKKIYEQAYNQHAETIQRQKIKFRKQLEETMPINHPVNLELQNMKRQEEQLRRQNQLVEANELQNKIKETEKTISEQYASSREKQINRLAQETENRYNNELQERIKHQQKVIDQMEDEKEKKIKEIREVHAKQNESLKANYQGKMKLTI